jgi:hypothetical protein
MIIFPEGIKAAKDLISMVEQMEDHELELLLQALVRDNRLVNILADQPIKGDTTSINDLVSWSGLGPY